VFFGIQNGDGCYCMPYYKVMAADSSNCDVPCEGEPDQICGGKSKSSIFEMHFCDSSADDAKLASDQAEKAIEKAKEVGEKGKKIVAFPWKRLGVECMTEKTAGLVQCHVRCRKQCSECGRGTAQLVRGIPGCQKAKEPVHCSGMRRSQ